MFHSANRSVRARRFLRGERFEDRALMAGVGDLYVNTNALWGGDVTPGHQDVPVAEFQLIGARSVPRTLEFESSVGVSMRDLVERPTLVADLYRVDARGRRTLGSDGVFESTISRGIIDADGDLRFRFGGIGNVLAYRGVPLQVQVDVLPGAEDGMPIAFERPTVGFLYPHLCSRVHQIGYDNPVYTVNGVDDVTLSVELSSDGGSISPGDNDFTLGTFTFETAGSPAYVDSFYVAVEGRHGDNSLIADVDRSVEDIELRDPRTGQVYYGRPVAEKNGIEIVQFQGIYVDGTVNLEVQMDQEGAVAGGDKFRVHGVVQSHDSGVGVDIGGLTGQTDEFNLRAFAGDWNDRLTIEPGGVLSGNFRTVVVPQLNVAVRDIGGSDTAVKNEKDILLVRMEVRADGEDLLFTQASFQAEVGSILNVRNATVWFDSDGNGETDTIAQTNVSAVGGQFRFANFVGGGFIIPDGEAIVVELHADVASSLTTSTLRMDVVPGSIQAEEVDSGTSLAASQVVVNSTVDSKTWNFVNQGDLFVTLDSTPSRSRQLLGGTLESTILRVQLRAQNEDIDVYRMFISLTGIVNSVDRLEVFKDGATAPFAIATVAGVGTDPVPAGYTTFSFHTQNGQLVVPDGSNVDILVRPRMKNDAQGLVSGEAVTANVVTVGAFQPVLARGWVSSNNLLPNDGDAVAEGETIVGVEAAGPNVTIVGNPNVAVGSEFATFANANPDADNSNVPVGISPFAQFQITTATNSNTLYGLNRAALDSFVIYVDATNVSMDSSAFNIYNKADSSVKFTAVAESLAGTVLSGPVTGNFRVRVSGLAASAVDAIFESGETSTLVLEGDILDPEIDPMQDSVLQGSLDLTDAFFAWFDRDAVTNRRINGVEYPDMRVRSTRYRS